MLYQHSEINPRYIIRKLMHSYGNMQRTQNCENFQRESRMPTAMTAALFEAIRTRRHLRFTGLQQEFASASIASYSKIRKLERHSGCINTVNWNDSGTRIVTGSDDRSVVIWSGETFDPIITVPTGHRNNVFCATFVPGTNDEQILTCAADGCVHLLNVESGERDVLYASPVACYCFRHCMDPTNPSQTGLVTVSHGSVMRYDLRAKSAIQVFTMLEERLLWRLALMPPSGTALAFNPIDPYMLALGTSTKAVLLYDTRKLSVCGSRIIPEFTKFPSDEFPEDSVATSGFAWDRRNGLIVNFCRQSVIELDVGRVSWRQEPVRYPVGRCKQIPRQWTGRENHQTFLKEVALIGDIKYIATGGDDGSLYIWDRFDTQKLIFKKPADPYVLNCIAPHPTLPLLATAGIASVADIWDTYHITGDVYSESDSEEEYEGPPARPRSDISVDDARERIFRARDQEARGEGLLGESEWGPALAEFDQAIALLNFECVDADETLENLKRESIEKALEKRAVTLLTLSLQYEALQACEDVLEINPRSRIGLICTVKCQISLGYLESCGEYIQRLLSMDPEDQEVLDLRSQVNTAINSQPNT